MRVKRTYKTYTLLTLHYWNLLNIMTFGFCTNLLYTKIKLMLIILGFEQFIPIKRAQTNGNVGVVV